MTDKEIIKALECCVNNDSCKECPINPNYGNYGYCTNLALTHALALINRQQAEIAKHEKENHEKFNKWLLLDKRTKERYAELYEEAKGVVRAETTREFAERLASKVSCIPQHHFTLAQVLWDIDTLVKEMTEGQK